jgi:hypothetical protein
MLKDSCSKNRPLKAILRLKRRSEFKTNGALFCGDILPEQRRKHLTLFQWAQLKSNAQIVNVYAAKDMEPRVGVEPTTCRLRIGCSTTELPRPNPYKQRRSALRALGVWPIFGPKVPEHALTTPKDAKLFHCFIAFIGCSFATLSIIRQRQPFALPSSLRWILSRCSYPA